MKKTDEYSVDNLVIGFGMSAIPIIRELEISGEDFKVLSKEASIWRKMEKSDNLNFDLVSTRFCSFFSWDLWKFKEDLFPTAKEFVNYQKSYYEKYKDRITKDWVKKIYNHKDYSIVETEEGNIYKAKNVIISSGLKRKIADSIVNFDRKIQNKTIVLSSSGDTANMLISDLISGGNKIYLLTNGGPTCLNKCWYDPNFNQICTLDQFEFQNLGFFSKKAYEDLLSVSFSSATFQHGKIKLKAIKNLRTRKDLNLKQKILTLIDSVSHNVYKYFARFTSKNLFQVKFGTEREVDCAADASMTSFNQVFVKYWPIDVYHKLFAKDIEGSIKNGYKLNDLTFFINEGLVKVLNKKIFNIDRDKKEIYHSNNIVKYDYLIEGNTERPGLDDIEIIKEDGACYKYVPRENFLGVIPKDLNNIYIIGATRPSTGGLANITEMQSLLIHHMITNKTERLRILNNIEEKIKEYNKKYFFGQEELPLDHVVGYGFYNEEIARQIGLSMNYKLSDLLKSLAASFWKFKTKPLFLLPNNCFMYRLKGKYKTQKPAKLLKNFLSNYNFRSLGFLILNYYLYHFIFLAVNIKCLALGMINLPLALCFGVMQFCFSRFVLLLIEKALALKFFVAFAWAVSTPFTPLLFDAVFACIELASLPVLRKFGHNSVFNDLSGKHNYRSFFYQEYLPILKRLICKSS